MIHGRRIVAGVAGAVALLAVVVMPAVAAATLTVSPPSGAPGQVLHAIGTGFSADQQIKLQWDAGFLPETGTSDGSGAFDIPFAIPTVATLGGHVLRACIRGVCSQAVPFTVSVVAATPPPVATPVPSASAASSATPEPSIQSSAPPPSESPSSSAVPSDSGAPTTSESPLPAASASSVILPTAAPSALPGEPSAPGTVKVQFPWDRIAIAAALGLGVLLIFLAAANEKWLKDSGGMFFGKGSYPSSTGGQGEPAGGGFTPNLKLRRNAEKGETSAKTPKLYEAAAKGTHAPAKPDPSLPNPEIGNPEIANPSVEKPNDAPEDAATPTAEPDVDATKDVRLKGKNIGEN